MTGSIAAAAVAVAAAKQRSAKEAQVMKEGSCNGKVWLE
jgi:hypothetical protein